MNPRNHRNEDLLRLLDAALAAHEHEDDSAFQAAADALVQWRSRPLQKVLGRLAQELSDSLATVPLPAAHDAGLVHDLPDARSRLDYVVYMTEQAAHRTLDGVEACRRHVDALAARPLPAACAPLLEDMRRELSEMALAQEYQDLTGQIIRRVIGVVHRVESALSELGVRASADGETAPELAGPALPQVDTCAVSQHDADALLSGLGL